MLDQDSTRNMHHTSCQVEPLHKPVSAQQLAEAETAYLLVRGMGCPTCALRVRNALLQMDGVVAADVHLGYGIARVWYQSQVVQPETVGRRLPELADDGRHHYSAQVIVFSGESDADDDAARAKRFPFQADAHRPSPPDGSNNQHESANSTTSSAHS